MSPDVRAIPATDIEVLNELLAAGLSLSVVKEPGSEDPSAQGRGPAGNPVHPRARVVLVQSTGRGPRREASRRLRLTSGRRPLLLALSKSLAECAMDLGLGASVCRPQALNRLETESGSCENA